MTYTKLLKSQAKRQLSGNWVCAAAGVLVLAAAGILCSCVFDLLVFAVNSLPRVTDGVYNLLYAASEILCLSLIWLLSPFLLGYLRLCYGIAENKKTEFCDMFYYFSDRRLYRGALGVSFGFIWRFACFFAAGSVLTGALCGIALSLSLAADLISAIYDFLFYLTAVLAVLFTLRYTLAAFVFFENEDFSRALCFRFARKIRKLQKKSILRLILSFFPWYLLLFFVLPIMYIFPYVTVSVCNFAKWSMFNSLPYFSKSS